MSYSLCHKKCLPFSWPIFSTIICCNCFNLRLTLVFDKCFIGFEGIESIDFTLDEINNGESCEVINKSNEISIADY